MSDLNGSSEEKIGFDTRDTQGGVTTTSIDDVTNAAKIMKKMSQYFIRGALTLLPFGLTVYVLWLFLDWSEDLTAQAVSPIFGDFYVRGMGILFGVLALILLGYVISNRFMEKVFFFVEVPFKNVPLVKSIYTAVKNLSEFVNPGGAAKHQQVVVVKFPDHPIEMIGFVTRSNLSSMPAEITKENRVAVFFPFSYQVGGMTVFVPKEWTRPTNLSVEVAMRSALTAWMPGTKE